METYLRRLAEDNSSAFASTLAADESSGGASVKMTFERGGSSRLRGEPMYYGGRGIKVCDQWKDFAAFHADMGDRPPGMSIDRIDVNEDYEPINCRWADKETQVSNTRRNRTLTINGTTKTLMRVAITPCRTARRSID